MSLEQREAQVKSKEIQVISRCGNQENHGFMRQVLSSCYQESSPHLCKQ